MSDRNGSISNRSFGDGGGSVLDLCIVGAVPKLSAAETLSAKTVK